MDADPGDQAGGPEPLDEAFRVALAELDEYLEDLPDERLVESVLPFASRWVLTDVGLDLERLRHEARLLVESTPMPARVLEGYADQAGYWVSQRMLLDGDEQLRPELAASRLEAARRAVEARADQLEAEGYERVARGFRAVLEETAGGTPPADLLWTALAVRIAESVID